MSGNSVRGCILAVRNLPKGSPEAALVLANMWLRGGQATREQIYKDADEWEAKHGAPTWEKLLAWAEGMEMEANLADPIVKSTVYGR